jgi:L-lysine exporter family protein LysE/ArgO
VGVIAPLATGFLTLLALIVAVGAQNAFVLRQGVLRHHVGVVVAICALSDAVLVMLGVAGLGAVVTEVPLALRVVQWAGVAFLAAYGVMALRRAARGDALSAATEQAASLRRVVLTTLALTWLNPHVYLDTVLLLGSLAQAHGPDGRWWFGVGAALGSLTWFTVIGYGAGRVRAFLARPVTWRWVETGVGVVMLALAPGLALHAPA